MTKNFISRSLNDTQQIGRAIYSSLQLPSCVYLHGDLGAGKTSLCQAMINAAGYQGVVTSPTYNLIQEYPVNAGTIYHMDLYRLNCAEELEYLGVEDLWAEQSLFLIEWPEKGVGFLQAADTSITIQLTDADQHRLITVT